MIEDDILSSHVTWGDYSTMTRVIKKFDFDIDVPGRQISFSGYPGIVYSGDDFNVMQPSQLMTLETTIDIYNLSLWDTLSPEGTIFTPFRAVVANRLANSAAEWVDLFSPHNSGTYNNEWFVVDYKKVPLTAEEKDVVWILDQAPGKVLSQDRGSKQSFTNASHGVSKI